MKIRKLILNTLFCCAITLLSMFVTVSAYARDNSDYIDFKANSVADADCSSSELSAHEEATCTLMDRFIESFIEEQLYCPCGLFII